MKQTPPNPSHLQTQPQLPSPRCTKRTLVGLTKERMDRNGARTPLSVKPITNRI